MPMPWLSIPFLREGAQKNKCIYTYCYCFWNCECCLACTDYLVFPALVMQTNKLLFPGLISPPPDLSWIICGLGRGTKGTSALPLKCDAHIWPSVWNTEIWWWRRGFMILKKHTSQFASYLPVGILVPSMLFLESISYFQSPLEAVSWRVPLFDFWVSAKATSHLPLSKEVYPNGSVLSNTAYQVKVTTRDDFLAACGMWHFA